MSLRFPTGRGGRAIPGEPQRASHCTCVESPLCSDPDEPCHRCGKYRKETIAETFETRAQTIAARNIARQTRTTAKKRRSQ